MDIDLEIPDLTLDERIERRRQVSQLMKEFEADLASIIPKAPNS